MTSRDFVAHTSPLFQSISILKFEDIYKNFLMNNMFQTLTLHKYPTLRQKLIKELSVHRYGTRKSNALVRAEKM